MPLKFIFSPLEQFEILIILPLYLEGFDFSITNETIILSIVFLFFTIFFSASLNPKDLMLNLIPNKIQTIFESIYGILVSLIVDNLGKVEGQKYFPVLFSIFLYVITLNLIGLIPYSFTLTSHLIVTFTLALFIFIALNIICIKKHKFSFFSLFFPGGTSVILAFLLVPIELISYIFKPVSLSIRLFANMMAGHTLLKVIAGFGWALSGSSGILFLIHYIPLLILIPLFGLELGVALIQSFVFLILVCIYLNDSIHLH